MPSRLTAEEISWVAGMRGLNDSIIPGSNMQFTDDLRNVKARYGRIFGRGGMSKYLGITAPATNSPIVGLFHFPLSEADNQLIRMTLTKLEKLNTGTSVWDDITGNAFANVATTRPQHTIIDNKLVVVNEGLNRPQKFSGSGTSGDTTANDNAPFAKVVAESEGFLLLGNISDDGTFTDLPEGKRTMRYADDWETTFISCPGDAREVGDIILHLTPGAVVGALKLGRELVTYKEDGFVRLVWTPGAVVWKQYLMPTPIGTNSPLTIKSVLNKFHLVLGIDGLIYKVAQADAVPVTDILLANTLHTPTIRDLGRYRFARALVDAEETLYILFYDRTGLSGQFLNSYVTYNYLTGEVTKGELGQQIICAEAHRPTKTSREVALISTDTLIEEFDSTAVDDDGVKISRFWTTGWQKLSGGVEGWFTGAIIIMKQSKRARIRISVAVDFEDSFNHFQNASLASTKTADDRVEILYSPPSLKGEWFNVKIELIHGATTAETEVLRVGFMGVPLKRTLIDKTTASTVAQGIA